MNPITNQTRGRRFCGWRLIASLGLLASAGSAAGAESGGWQPDTWRGERAFTAVAGGWKATVSIDRGRLMYFGAAEGDHNLLFAPPTRDGEIGWGGHRVWCGPQEKWAGGWPPPAAWEHSAAASATVEGERLVLAMPASGDGWPRITREYFWRGGALHCRVRLTGGTRPAQIIQILQVPATAAVSLAAVPEREAPRGYVLVHLGRHPSPQGIFPPRPQVAEAGPDRVLVRFTGAMEKLAFRPQTLVAQIGGTRLRVARGASEGEAESTPDDGFTTQVYLGSTQAALIELEQLSPLWRAGRPASFEIVMTGG